MSANELNYQPKSFQVSESMQAFIAHFGEMGSRWGINRTVGQIYALLFLVQEPICVDDICKTLGFSRTNVSMGLKELDGWQLLKTKYYPKDRKEYFTVLEDVWQIFRTLVEERKKREIEPTLSMLRDVLMTPANSNEEYSRKKMQEMYELIEMLVDWYVDMQKLETKDLLQLLKLGSKVLKLYQTKDKIKESLIGKKNNSNEE